MPGITLFPCLILHGKASEAAAFYCSIFENSFIRSDSGIAVNFSLDGNPFMILNDGPNYQVNESISFYVYCGGDDKIEHLYAQLCAGGTFVMPLAAYPWCRKYAWIKDKYGVSWQLDIDAINAERNIIPTFLFANEKSTRVKEASTFYQNIFPDSKTILEAPYAEGAGLPEGTLLFTQIKLYGMIFNAMSSNIEHDFDFNEATSFVVNCDTQEEIDHLWESLGSEGEYQMCGWLKDKFGISWQIIPSILGALMSDKEKSGGVIEAFLKMKKFDIKTLLEV